MLIGQSPFQGDNEDELYRSILNDSPFYPRYVQQTAVSCITQLLDRHAATRLGMPTSPHGSIRQHPFFSCVNWQKLETRQISPPFQPRVLSALDVRYFDADFTMEKVQLSKTDRNLLATIDQELFRGFSFTEPQMARTAAM